MHKGFKCLDASTSRIYISQDVIFDESIFFLFASIYLTIGALYHSDVLLILATHPIDKAITNETNVPTLSVLCTFESVQLQHEPVVNHVPRFSDPAVPTPPAPGIPAQPIISAHDEGGLSCVWLRASPANCLYGILRPALILLWVLPLLHMTPGAPTPLQHTMTTT
jgi:hypothetical protein